MQTIEFKLDPVRHINQAIRMLEVVKTVHEGRMKGFLKAEAVAEVKSLLDHYIQEAEEKKNE